MLKAWSQKRRDAAGPRFEPHPATRQLLLNETRRFHGQLQDKPERPGTFREFCSSLYPRLAVGLATVAVAGLAIWLIAPQLAQNPAYTFASKADREGLTPAERPATLSAPASAATDALVGRDSRRAAPSAPPAATLDARDESAKKKDVGAFQRLARKPSLAPADSQPAVGGRLTAAKSVADNKDLLLAEKVLKPTGAVAAKEEVESKFGVIGASGPAPSTAAKTPASPVAPAGMPAPVAASGYVSLALNEPKVSEAKPADGALAYSYGLEARADKDQSSTASTERLFKSPSVALRSEVAAADTPALNAQVKLSDETNAVTMTRTRLAGLSAAQSQITQNIGGNRFQPIAVAVQRFIQIFPAANSLRKEAYQNSAANQAVVNNAIVSNGLIAANGAMDQASLGVLQRFDLEQNGSRISLVDADGSVYVGEWIVGDMDLGAVNNQNQMNQATDNFAVAGRQKGVGGGGLGGVGENTAAQQYASPRLQVYFHADGVNQTLKQPVAVRGFLELATTTPVVQNTQASGAQSLNITRVQAQISMSTNAPTEIYAVPVKP